MRGMSRNAGILVAPPVPGYDAALDVRAQFNLDEAKACWPRQAIPTASRLAWIVQMIATSTTRRSARL